MDVKALCLWNL